MLYFLLIYKNELRVSILNYMRYDTLE